MSSHSSEAISTTPKALDQSPGSRANAPAAGGVEPGKDGASPPGATLQAVFIGAVLCLFISVAFTYNVNVVKGSYLALDHTAIGAIALYFVLTLPVNSLARLADRRHPTASLTAGLRWLIYGSVGVASVGWLASRSSDEAVAGQLLRVVTGCGALLTGLWSVLVVSRCVARVFGTAGSRLSLTRADVLTILAMMLVASAICTMGLGEQLGPAIAGPQYYKYTHHGWIQHVIPHLPDWLIVTDAEAAKVFFEGLPQEIWSPPPWASWEPIASLAGVIHQLGRIPWSAWVRPLAWWALFLLSLYGAMTCMMVIIRRQWMAREILIYPMMRLPLEMAEEGESNRVIGPLFRRGSMWIGFALPAVMTTLRAMPAYIPEFPMIRSTWEAPIIHEMSTLHIYPSFVAIGFAYLINVRVAFSVWTFSLAAVLLSGFIRFWGIASDEHLQYGSDAFPDLYHLGTGALLTMTVAGLWSARNHLASVFRKAFGRHPETDDSDEILSYRSAVIGLLVCTAFMVGWLVATGMSVPVAVIFWLVVMGIFYGMTRIVVESGLSACVAPGIAPGFVTSKLGLAAIGAQGMTAMAMTYPWCADIRTFVMTSVAHGLKATAAVRRRRRVLVAILVAIVLTMVISVASVIYISHVHSGINMNAWFFVSAPTLGLDYAVYVIRNDAGPNVRGWIASLIGAVAMVGMVIAHRRILRWPFHPIGLAVMGIWLMRMLWFAIFIAWLIKTLVLRFGGPRTYAKTVPFFLGLILGQAVAAAGWCLIDYCTGTTEHGLFWI